MQHYKKITSLAEDFNALGLISNKTAKVQAKAQEKALTESASDGEAGEGELSEARLKVIRVKRMSPSKRAKARIGRRKRKAKINRKRRLKAKRSKTKMRMKRFKNLKKGRSAGKRRRFRLVTGMEKYSNLFENLQNLQVEGDQAQELVAAFENISKFSNTLGRKFAVMEEILDEMDMGAPHVEHPDSEYGYEHDDTNVKAGGKEGDATDYAKDAPKGNVKAEAKMDDEDEEDEDEMDESVQLEASDCEDEDEDEDEDEMDEEIDMSMELARLQLEAEDVLMKMKQHVISPAQAGTVLKDMVQYLGGALGMYIDVAKELDAMDHEYEGEDMPPVDKTPVKDPDSHEVIGKDQPKEAGMAPAPSKAQ